MRIRVPTQVGSVCLVEDELISQLHMYMHAQVGLLVLWHRARTPDDKTAHVLDQKFQGNPLKQKL